MSHLYQTFLPLPQSPMIYHAVFAFGSNGSGQLGVCHKEDIAVPRQVQFHPDSSPSEPIAQIAAGGNHTLLLTTSGRIYWSGDSSSGACGVVSPSTVSLFQELHPDQQDAPEIGSARLVAATWEASFVVTTDDRGRATKLFSLGLGAKGELGCGELVLRASRATLVEDFPPPDTEIVSMSACCGHVVAVLSSGEAYGWGNCRKSQIGHPGAVVYSPRRIDNIGFKVTRAVCTKEATCFFGEPKSGHIRIVGSDKWGLCSKAPLTAPAWIDVGAGWGNIYILGQDRTLQAWGRDDYGQLPPPNLPGIVRVAVGSEHVVALSEKGEVLSWGWSEHGNCGPLAGGSHCLKGRWNVITSLRSIPLGSRISNLGAGCATSWICIDRS